MPPLDFAHTFQALTGSPPFPWQTALYERLVRGEIPASANIPTGLGKTAVIAVWLCALAGHPDRVPRRLVYVVNRRTVVDQTTTEVEKWRDNIAVAGIHSALTSLCAIPLPLGEQVELFLLRGPCDSLRGRLDLTHAPDLPLNPRQPLALSIAGVAFSSRDIDHWKLA